VNQAFPIFGVTTLESQAEGASDEPAASSEAVLPICFAKDDDDDEDDDDDMFKAHRNKILLGISSIKWGPMRLPLNLRGDETSNYHHFATGHGSRHGVPTLKKPENILRYLLAILY
jgi:hypothetical protein